MRWEIAALAGRLRTLEAERDDWQVRHDEVERDRNRQRDLVLALRRSRSFRMGRAIAAPARAIRDGAARRLRGRPDTAPRQRGDRVAAGTLPAYVYLAIGLAPDALRAFTRALAQRLMVDADHVPVVVTDCPTFRVAQVRGVVLEYLPDARTWGRHRPDVPWDDLLTDRLARLFRDHGCARTAVVDPEHPPTLADLLAG